MEQIVLQSKQEAKGMTAKLDQQEKDEIKSLAFNSGCTSCVVLIAGNYIYCANAGDSRACLATHDDKVVELSYDHKPENKDEMERIKAAGGFVDEGRVQGIIAVSRAIGDWEYKNPALLHKLEKKKTPLKKKSTLKEEKKEENK